ncbi:BTB/POZ domain-containing protein 3-like protein [Aphelenchoides avenae]|nr:BTB/POZ domain-containing protein 3-like protein [Aphelenchus avenae]
MPVDFRSISSNESEAEDYDFNQMPVVLSVETSVVLSVGAAEIPIQLSSALLMPELSDVQISVVDNQKKPKLFHAHKLLLALASEVFKTMFFGSVPQENPVVVKDSNPAAFEAFLRFVYTGTTTITEADIFTLLYIGKKYMVGSLVKVVLNHLEGCITSANVGQLMLSGQDFLEDAPPKFWKRVETHGEALLKSEGFLQLRKDTVKALVQRELEADEKLVYDKAVAWAAAECARNQLPVDGETLRNALEGILQHVRFPAMTAEEFAEGPAGEEVLTAEEKVHVLRWFAASIPQSIFPDTPRFTGLAYVCERLTSRMGPWDISGRTQAIDFSVNRAISVIGLGVFHARSYRDYSDSDRDNSDSDSDYSIVATLALGSAVLAKNSLAGTTRKPVSVNFDKPIKIDANKRYAAAVVVTGPQTYYGGNGTTSKTVSTKKGDVVFNFMQAASTARTTVAQGMIPQIHFRI